MGQSTAAILFFVASALLSPTQAGTIERSVVFDLSAGTVRDDTYGYLFEADYVPFDPFYIMGTWNERQRITLNFSFLPGQTLYIGNYEVPNSTVAEYISLVFGPVQAIGSRSSGTLGLEIVSGSATLNPLPFETSTSGSISILAGRELTASFIEISGGTVDFFVNTGGGFGNFNTVGLYANGSPVEARIGTISAPSPVALVLLGAVVWLRALRIRRRGTRP